MDVRQRLGLNLKRLRGTKRWSQGGAVKLSRDRGESLVERNAHPTRIDGFAYPTFPKLRGPTPKNVGNWVNLTAPDGVLSIIDSTDETAESVVVFTRFGIDRLKELLDEHPSRTPPAA